MNARDEWECVDAVEGTRVLVSISGLIKLLPFYRSLNDWLEACKIYQVRS